jgi:hypothetical protein
MRAAVVTRVVTVCDRSFRLERPAAPARQTAFDPGQAARRSVSGDCYASFLYHQHLCGLRRHRAVQHPARDRECHTGSQLHWVAALEFGAQAAVDDVEELVLLLVLVPVGIRRQ